VPVEFQSDHDATEAELHILRQKHEELRECHCTIVAVFG
jgi:hypothetical protein